MMVPELVLTPEQLARLRAIEARTRAAHAVGDRTVLSALLAEHRAILDAATTAAAVDATPHPIVGFLHARADEIDRAAAVLIGWHGPRVTPTAHEDARLADAIRTLVALHRDAHGDGYCATCDQPGYPQAHPCPTLRALAAVWQTRPGYTPDWTPA